MHEPVHTVKVGMGAIPYEAGVAFRVWAPHADRVFVMSSFNNWLESHPMQPGDNGTWYAGGRKDSRACDGKEVLVP